MIKYQDETFLSIEELLVRYGLLEHIAYFTNRYRYSGDVHKTLSDTIDYAAITRHKRLRLTVNGWLCDCGTLTPFSRSIALKRTSCGCRGGHVYKKQSTAHLSPQHLKAWRNYLRTRPDNPMSPDQYIAHIGNPPGPKSRYIHGRWINNA